MYQVVYYTYNSWRRSTQHKKNIHFVTCIPTALQLISINEDISKKQNWHPHFPLFYNIRRNQLIMKCSAPSTSVPITPLHSFSPCSSLRAADQHQSDTHTNTHTTVLPVTFSKERNTPMKYSLVGRVTTLRTTRCRVWILTAVRNFSQFKIVQTGSV